MTIHVNIAEAKARLSALLDAALKGEEVILQKSGVPLAKIVPIEEADFAKRAAVARERMANIGKFRDKYAGVNLDIGPSLTDAEAEARFKRKFG